MHIRKMQPRGDIFFQITFTNFSSALLQIQTVKGHVISYLVKQVYKACNQCDLNVVAGNNRTSEENKSIIN